MGPSPLRATLERMIAETAIDGSHPFLVFDAVWQEDLARQVRAGDEGWEPLMGSHGEHRHDAHPGSPLIVDLDCLPTVIDPWLDEGFPAKLGIVVFSDLSLAGLRASLKRFTSLLIPEFRSPAYFRFYDARVLYCFLTTGFSRQWADFTRDIQAIAAPSDLSPGWTVFEVADGALTITAENASGGPPIKHRLTGDEDQDADYDRSFPFRRIGDAQYAAILTCTRRGQDREIHDFLLRAFPDDMVELPEPDSLARIARARATAESLSYDSEDSVFYWAVLSMMAGERFHEADYTAHYLQIAYMSPENKLETLIEEINRTLRNPHLTDLIDVYEVELADASGRRIRYKERSGRVLWIKETTP
jgi:hypothetical protein